MQTEVTRNAEYAALRATIRERGTVRMLLIPLVFTAWAAVAIATAAVITVALSTLVPLLWRPVFGLFPWLGGHLTSRVLITLTIVLLVVYLFMPMATRLFDAWLNPTVDEDRP